MGGASEAPAIAGAPVDARAHVTLLFHHHYRRLVGLAALLVDDRESAEEVVQDAFESLYRHWRGLRDQQAALAYLNRSVVNGSRSRLRRRVAERSYTMPPAGMERSAESSEIERRQRHELVLAVRALPQRQREVVVLRYFLDLSETQIAELLGISRGAVKRHASRARATLQQRMAAWA